MDLLAVAPAAKNAITVHRLNWQKLLTVNEPSFELGAFAWTASGRGLSCLSHSRQFYVWSTETGACVQQLDLGPGFDGARPFLSWASVSLSEEQVKRFESSAPGVFGAVDAAEVTHVSELFAGLAGKTEAVVVTLGTHAEVLLRGVASVARLRLPHPARAAWLSHDWKHLVCVALEQNKGGQDQVVVCALPLDRVSKHVSHLSELAKQWQMLVALGNQLRHKLQELQEVWRAAAGAVRNAIQQLDQRLAQTQEGIPTEEALLDIMLCGMRIAGTDLWMGKDIGEKGATRLLRGVSEALQSLTDAFKGPLLTLVEHMAYRADEAQELCRWEEFQDLGLQSCFTDLAVRLDQLYELTKRFPEELEKKKLPMLSFCRWLLRYQRLILYEESHTQGEEGRTKDLEKLLLQTRISEPFDELHVYEFMQHRLEDQVMDVLEPLAQWKALEPTIDLLPGQVDQSALLAHQDIWANASVKVPIEGEDGLLGVSFYSDEVQTRVLLHRRDDLAFVDWSGNEEKPVLGVYDAPEGEIVGAEFYKNGNIVVLTADKDQGKGWLFIVEGYDETKTRELNFAPGKLAVSKDRGLAAALASNSIVVFDLEAEEEGEEEDDGGPAPMDE